MKITTPGGKIIKCTMGEGPMFEDSESETESESRVVEARIASPRECPPESVKEPSVPLSLVNQVSSETNLSVLSSEFNNMLLSAYSSFPSYDCFNSQLANKQNNNELIKAMEEHEKKTFVIEQTEKVDISDNDTPREIQIGLTLSPQERDELVATLKEFRDFFCLVL